MTVCRVDHDDVDTRCDERCRSFFAIGPWSDRRADAETPVFVLQRIRVPIRLQKVLDRNEPDELLVAVDDEELLDAMLMQELLRALVRNARRHGDELFRHQPRDGLVLVLRETRIARGEDADRMIALDDGHAADVVLAHHAERLAEGLIRSHRDGCDHHAALGALHVLDFARLCGGREVLVEDAHPAGPRHRNRGGRFGHGIHRSADERNVECDASREARLRRDLGREHFAVRRDEKNVVECEAFAKAVVEHART